MNTIIQDNLYLILIVAGGIFVSIHSRTLYSTPLLRTNADWLGKDLQLQDFTGKRRFEIGYLFYLCPILLIYLIISISPELLSLSMGLAGTSASVVDRLENTKLSGYINEKMGERFGTINREMAKTIQTDECPRGFDRMPIRKYEDHTDGVQKFCEGEVLYYLGDYDIINNKIREHSHCKATMNRFTRTKEVYGVFFADRDYYCPGNHENTRTAEACAEDPPSSGTRIDVLRFYSEFNSLLFKAMQGKESAIEKIFSKSFIGQEKSEELHEFFQNFKIASFDD